MVVVKDKNGRDRVARIDFGHAFNDLMTVNSMLGGQMQNKSNSVLDFFNRSSVAGAQLRGDKTKLWRDYGGMLIQSDEMVEALKHIGSEENRNKISDSLDKVKQSFDELHNQNTKEGKKHIIDSLTQISQNVGLSYNKKDLKTITEKTADPIGTVFENLKKNYGQKLSDMQDVAKLLELQRKIDKLLIKQSELPNYQPDPQIIQEIRQGYADLKQKPAFSDKNNGISWIKTDANRPAISGSLENFIQNRAKDFFVTPNKTKEILNHIESGFPAYGLRVGQKTGGIHAPDPDGGIYKDGNDTFLIKRDTKSPENDIAEYLAAAVFNVTAPGSGAEIDLVKNNNPDRKGLNNNNAFLASKYFKNYKDLFQESGYENRPETWEAMGWNNHVKKILANKEQYKGYDKSVATSLLLGDFSLHSGNIGVVNNPNTNEKELVRIDFGAAFRKLSEDINPFKSQTNRVGGEKNYFLRDHPRERFFSQEFADEMRKIGSLDIPLEENWKKIKDNFDEKAIQKFGQQIGLNQNAKESEIKDHFTHILKQRQQSMLNLATEVELKTTTDIKKIQDIVKTNPDFCKNLLEEKAKLQIPDNIPAPNKIHKRYVHNALIDLGYIQSEKLRRPTKVVPKIKPIQKPDIKKLNSYGKNAQNKIQQPNTHNKNSAKDTLGTIPEVSIEREYSDIGSNDIIPRQNAYLKNEEIERQSTIISKYPNNLYSQPKAGEEIERQSTIISKYPNNLYSQPKAGEEIERQSTIISKYPNNLYSQPKAGEEIERQGTIIIKSSNNLSSQPEAGEETKRQNTIISKYPNNLSSQPEAGEEIERQGTIIIKPSNNLSSQPEAGEETKRQNTVIDKKALNNIERSNSFAEKIAHQQDRRDAIKKKSHTEELERTKAKETTSSIFRSN
jgi:hypothetical protein